MELTEMQLALYEKAKGTLLFDDLYELVLTLWPEQIDTSKRDYVNYEKMTGLIQGLSKFDDSHQTFWATLDIGNLLVHLDHCILIAVHNMGLCQDVVRLKEINKSYMQFLFEDKSIRYAIEEDVEKIPMGLRGSLESLYDKKLIEEYFFRTKRKEKGSGLFS